jgi:hypothetical protein
LLNQRSIFRIQRRALRHGQGVGLVH